MLNSVKTIVFQGDSITDCGRNREFLSANSGLGEGYPLLISAELLATLPEKDLRIFNRGISGNRIVDLYARWKLDALNLKPDLLSILIGVNDTWHEKASQNGVEVERYEMFYRMLLQWTKNELPAIRLLLCQPFVLHTGAVGSDWIDEISARGEVVKRLAEEFDAVYLPLQEVFDAAEKRAPADYWLGDGVHPTFAGHKLIADAWIKAVAKF